MATINNILSGSAGVKKRYQIGATVSNIGTPLVISTTEAGLILATTGGAADLVGLNLTTATLSTTQGTGTSTAEALVDVIINPDAVYRYKLSGGATEGTALAVHTVTVADSGGTTAETGTEWSSPTMLQGSIWGYGGSNVGQIRKITTVSSTVGTVLTPFDYGTVVGDTFLRAPFWPMDCLVLQLTAAFYEVNASIATTTGSATWLPIDSDLRDSGDDGRNNSFVEVLAGDHFLARGT